MRSRTVLLIAVVLSLVLTLAVASATVHTGGITYAEPTNPPTIGPPEPPAVEQAAYLHTFSVAYDDQAGTVTLTVEVFDPAHWGYQFPVLFFKANPACGDEAGLYGRLAGGTEGSTATASLAGINGESSASGSFNGQTTTFAFQSPYFVAQGWRCVVVSPSASGRGAESFALGGYPSAPPPEAAKPKAAKPKAVVAHRATRAQLAAMTKAANAHHTDGFNVHRQYLTNAHVTSNGWADAEQRFRHPANVGQTQAGVFIVFHVLGGHWHAVTFGSAVCEAGQRAVPAAVCRALRL
jgi:hypothetical protein